MKMPKHVNGYIDRHGKARFYLRRKGNPQVSLPGLPWSPAFMAAYQEAMQIKTDIVILDRVANPRIKPGSVDALVNSYLNSVTFDELAGETKRTRKNILKNFTKEHGGKRAAMLQRMHIMAMFKKKAGKRFAARNWLKTVRALMQFGVADNQLKEDPTAGIENLSGKTEGFKTWSDEDIARFQRRWPLGTRERLALELLLCTAQRRGDIVSMGRQYIRSNAIELTQQKTGTKLAIPVHPDLKMAIGAMPSGHLTFLVTSFGKPFTAAGFTNWFRTVCNQAGLPPGNSAHGLRKAACRRLAEAGCTVHEIAAISGHADLREIARYTRAVDQARMARAGMGRLLSAGGGDTEPEQALPNQVTGLGKTGKLSNNNKGRK